MAKFTVTVIEALVRLPWALDDRIFIPFMSFLLGRLSQDSALWLSWTRILSRRRAVIRYTDFARLALQALEGEEFSAVRKCMLWWSITSRRLANVEGDILLIPHKLPAELPGIGRRALYYNQAIYPWLFTLDSSGWGAAISNYPVSLRNIERNPEAFAEFKRSAGENTSKYPQPQRLERSELVKRRTIPDGDFIFFPCQVPDDSNIRHFANFGYYQVIEAVSRWAQRKGVAMVLKLHPYAEFDSKQLSKFRSENSVTIVNNRDASVHDLIEYSRAVYTVNSSVGLEAFLHCKPVVVFGRTLYDCAAIPASGLANEELDRVWNKVTSISHRDLEDGYTRFFTWLSKETINLCIPDEAKSRIRDRVRAAVLSSGKI